MRGGYAGKLLKVDLSKGTVEKAPLPEEAVLRKWIGGTGLGLHLLCQNMRVDAKATDEDAPVVMMTGPLTGTKAPSSSDWKIVTINPELYFHPTISQGHGFWGARLKQAGYDGIIITGISPEPVYLWIDDDKVELRSAAKYWGMDTFDTQRRIQVDHGDVERISVACIGPAGEQELMGASVRCDRAYGANKGSGGVVWGHKKLKAIAIRGTKSVPIADYPGYIDVCDEWRNRIVQLKGEFAWLNEAGGIKCIPVLAQLGMIPALNFRDHEWQVKWGEKFAEDLAKWKIIPVGSWQCDFSCHHETVITTGKFAGSKAIGYGPENLEGAGTNLGVWDPGTCLAMANFYDAMGADPSESGRIMAMCFEMYEKGLLTEKDTGGLKLEWGDDEAVRELFMKMLYREPPLGNILAKGFREACRELGRNSQEMLMHIKGVGFNDHEQRGWGIGMLFQSLVSGAGPTWQGFGSEVVIEPDLGYETTQDPASPDGKAEAAFKTQAKKMWEDSTGVCLFVSWGIRDITKIEPRAVSLATGWDIDWEEARTVGERIIHLQRLYAVARGHKKAYDKDIAGRMLEPVPAGPAKGRELGPHLNRILDEYYGHLEWDLETGIPTPNVLRRMGLEGYKVGR